MLKLWKKIPEIEEGIISVSDRSDERTLYSTLPADKILEIQDNLLYVEEIIKNLQSWINRGELTGNMKTKIMNLIYNFK